MARTVDPLAYAARRLLIVDAALTRFAADGYQGATTRGICATAGIGSGTFFHYFPSKLQLLLAVLDLGRAETTDWFVEQEGRTDAFAVLLDWVARSARELSDPRTAGFVRAVGSVTGEPAVAAALADDEQVQREGLRPWVQRSQDAGTVRGDLPAERVVAWMQLLVDGFAGRTASAESFSAEDERGLLLETASVFLSGTSGEQTRTPSALDGR